MNWVTVIWSMIVSACLTLAGMHLLLWFRDREARANLLFLVTAGAAAATAMLELTMMRAHTIDQFTAALRWAQAPIWLLILSLVAFVQFHLRAGRPWLAGVILGLRTISLIINFASPLCLQYREITSLQPTLFLGEKVATAIGVTNPWVLIAQASNLLLLLYFADAAITLYGRTARRQAFVAGALTVICAIPIFHSMLIIWNVIHTPFVIAGSYLGMAAVMSFELSADVMLAGRLLREIQAKKNQLRDTEQRMDLAANAANVGMWVWDIRSQDFWMNERGRALFGFTPSEKLNFENILSAIHSEDRESVRQATHGYLVRGGDYETEYRIMRKDGVVRWVTARRRVEMDAGGNPSRMLGISLDITARKQAELEIDLQRRELAHLARVTTLGELSGSLAHELNQPLTAILSNAQAAQRFLRNGNADLAEVSAILEDVVEQNRRAGEVIHRLRQLFKKTDLQETSINPNDVVQEIAKLMRSDLLDHGVRLELELEPDLPTIAGDRIQLQQVLLNLMMNGCDAMAGSPPRERRLFVRTRQEGLKEMLISIQDSGCGIPAEDRERVFESFFTTKKDGMGLGLSVCRTILAAHRGKLWATANKDRGMTFHFSLPATKVPVST